MFWFLFDFFFCWAFGVFSFSVSGLIDRAVVVVVVLLLVRPLVCCL